MLNENFKYEINKNEADDLINKMEITSEDLEGETGNLYIIVERMNEIKDKEDVSRDNIEFLESLFDESIENLEDYVFRIKQIKDEFMQETETLN